ncbi:glycosyltransferase [Shewanella surugensis]|uniref:Glycosyltransferase n=1 Tax=Shewanella surugensis TaxID=212020 RepID=A0ABT0L9L6_9GAMM|nr:glycosyltransferase [Shewanella surugensis]MCL1124412.1 glycosyltransferase [Shewanella surugensis]
MMRIAIAIDHLVGGGAEKVMLTLAQEFVAMGHEVHFLVMKDNVDYEVPRSVSLHVCFAGKDRQLLRHLRLGKAVKHLKARIQNIESNVGEFGLFISNLDLTNYLMVKAHVRSLCVVVHASVEEELRRHAKMGPFAYFKKLRAKKVLNGQVLITVSKGIADEIVAKKRIHPASLQTIYNPFEFDTITALAQEQQNELPKEDYLIHIGRFVKQKRHDVLFAAIAQMKQPIKVVVLCHKPHKARKLARKLNVEDRVIIRGFEINPFPWIKQAKGLVLNSDFEGFGMVLVEALICGTPVVSTDCPHGPKEILTGSLADFLVPRRNPVLLAQKLDKVVLSPPDLTHIEILSKVKASEIAKQYLEFAN